MLCLVVKTKIPWLGKEREVTIEIKAPDIVLAVKLLEQFNLKDYEIVDCYSIIKHYPYCFGDG